MTTVRPGEYIGIIGGGQLGRMMADEAHDLGFKVVVLDPDENAPLCQVADARIIADYGDQAAVAKLAQMAKVVTYEFENVDAAVLAACEAERRLFPNTRLLSISQDRIQEKATFRALGLRTADYLAVTGVQGEPWTQVARFPVIVKTARGGYDGHGQRICGSAQELQGVLEEWRDISVVVEQVVPFDKEVSVVLSRDQGGQIVDFGLIENHHRNGILDFSISPAPVAPIVRERATSYAYRLAIELDLVGTMAVEFFVIGDDVLVNEMAPRPHNSGHLTIEAFEYSQFAQHIRAVAGLPLGQTRQLSAAAMANLLGDIWTASDQPNFSAALAIPSTHLHLYGKATPRPARKMGHLTVLADSPNTALRRADQARRALTGP
ncbi:5-(carboxyamino)imidazole ribonucleotide synthase [Sulfobacillus thermotolerans]|uniref:N5-carboxyaminoimidazole ribonucleotide synthase n=1 Tax=Sulfobacillus thermotolerans TaxID=338644 RepID=A0ABN5GZY6_9FIRM|nr:5-(carboxyamino)imidazole ribonucleotide synthase [Sulfobacillus thermotolerans]